MLLVSDIYLIILKSDLLFLQCLRLNKSPPLNLISYFKSIYDNYVYFLSFICLIRIFKVLRQLKIAELYVRTLRKCGKCYQLNDQNKTVATNTDIGKKKMRAKMKLPDSVL